MITWAQDPYCSDLGSCRVPRESGIPSHQFQPRICAQVEQMCQASSDADTGGTTVCGHRIRGDYEGGWDWIRWHSSFLADQAVELSSMKITWQNSTFLRLTWKGGQAAMLCKGQELYSFGNFMFWLRSPCTLIRRRFLMTAFPAGFQAGGLG